MWMLTELAGDFGLGLLFWSFLGFIIGEFFDTHKSEERFFVIFKQGWKPTLIISLIMYLFSLSLFTFIEIHVKNIYIIYIICVFLGAYPYKIKEIMDLIWKTIKIIIVEKLEYLSKHLKNK